MIDLADPAEKIVTGKGLDGVNAINPCAADLWNWRSGN
jgi:hypothetical protein